MRGMQGASDEVQLGQIRPLSVRVGVVEQHDLKLGGEAQFD